MKKCLTREDFLKKYPNPFELVSHAIGMVRDMVVSGRGPRVEVDNKNPAYIVLQEIAQGKDKIEEISKED